MCPSAPCEAMQLCAHRACEGPRSRGSLTAAKPIGVSRGGHMTDGSATEHDELVYESAGLPKTTNWWGAFVIGLAGTILVTGIAPVMVTELGASSVPVIVVITISGYIVCLLLAELSAMMPGRS